MDVCKQIEGRSEIELGKRVAVVIDKRLQGKDRGASNLKTGRADSKMWRFKPREKCDFEPYVRSSMSETCTMVPLV